MDKILIVGSSHSAYGALLKLESVDNIDITLIDSSDLEIKNSTDCVFSNVYSYPNRIKGDKYFDTSSFENIDKKTPYPSKIFGGNSNFWGGTLSDIDKEIINSFKKEGIQIEKYFELIKAKFNKLSFDSNTINDLNYVNTKRENRIYKNLTKFNNDYLQTSPSTICLDGSVSQQEINKNQICDVCKGYAWACKEDTIWSSKSYIKKLIESKKIKYLANTSLISFKDLPKEVSCYLKTDEKIKNFKFDKIFICAGAMGTAKILLNSFEELNSIEIKNSDLYTIPFFNIRRDGEKRHSFSDIFISYKNNANSFIQLYSFSTGVFKLSTDAVKIAKYFQSFPSTLFKNFGGLFVYIGQENSTRFLISKQNDILKYIEVNTYFNFLKYFKNVIIKLIKVGIIPLPFLLKKYSYGTSNHYGSSFPHNKNKEKFTTDRLGRLPKTDNVHILDATVLPIIPAGPIAVLICSNSYRIVEEIYS